MLILQEWNINTTITTMNNLQLVLVVIKITHFNIILTIGNENWHLFYKSLLCNDIHGPYSSLKATRFLFIWRNQCKVITHVITSTQIHTSQQFKNFQQLSVQLVIFPHNFHCSPYYICWWVELMTWLPSSQLHSQQAQKSIVQL